MTTSKRVIVREVATMFGVTERQAIQLIREKGQVLISAPLEDVVDFLLITTPQTTHDKH